MTFEKNDFYQFSRGFARKIPGSLAETRFGLDSKDEKVVWIAPDGKSIITNDQANTNNARRRSSLTMSDAWRDLKNVSPDVAKDIGWNGFQRLNRGAKGSRTEILRRLQRQGVSFESFQALSDAADGSVGDNNGWGDSG